MYQWLAAGLAGCIWATLVLGQERPEEWTENLPPGQAKELTVQFCGNSCHNLERTVRERKPREEWEATVYDMIGRGAPIFLDESEEIIVYLTDVLGPEAPPLVNVNAASEVELFQIPGITLEHATRLRAYRESNGLLASHQQIREILELEDEVFERIRYYLYAGAPATGP